MPLQHVVGLLCDISFKKVKYPLGVSRTPVCIYNKQVKYHRTST